MWHESLSLTHNFEGMHEQNRIESQHSRRHPVEPKDFDKETRKKKRQTIVKLFQVKDKRHTIVKLFQVKD